MVSSNAPISGGTSVKHSETLVPVLPLHTIKHHAILPELPAHGLYNQFRPHHDLNDDKHVAQNPVHHVAPLHCSGLNPVCMLPHPTSIPVAVPVCACPLHAVLQRLPVG